MEIFINSDGDIVLKKYSPIFDLKNFADDVCQSITDITESSVFICDLEKVIAVANASKIQYKNKIISSELEEYINQRKVYIGNVKNGSNISKLLYEELNVQYSAEIIVPLIFDGDVMGAIVLFRKEGDLSVTDVDILKVFANFIARQMS